MDVVMCLATCEPYNYLCGLPVAQMPDRLKTEGWSSTHIETSVPITLGKKHRKYAIHPHLKQSLPNTIFWHWKQERKMGIQMSLLGF